jgi:hypothetical protein
LALVTHHFHKQCVCSYQKCSCCYFHCCNNSIIITINNNINLCELKLNACERQFKAHCWANKILSSLRLQFQIAATFEILSIKKTLQMNVAEIFLAHCHCHIKFLHCNG